MAKAFSRNRIILIALLLVLLSIGESDRLVVANESGEDECTQTDSLVRNRYRCESDECGSKILHREHRRVSGCGLPSYDYYTSPTTFKDLESWLKCDPGQTSWQSNMVVYNCQGECLEAPTDPKYNSSPSSYNVDLPAELSWANVPGFGNMLEKGPISYNLTIENTNAEPGELGSFEFGHDYSGDGNFPIFSSLPGLDLSQGNPSDGQFVAINGKYRFIRPVPNNVRSITSCFGKRWESWKIPAKWGFHNGIDIGHGGRMTCTARGVRFGSNVCIRVEPVAGNSWIPIFAAAPGTITFAGDGKGAGNMVTIDHSAYNFDSLSDSSKKETRYMHLNNFSGSDVYGSIRSGDKITPGGEIWGTRKVGVDPETDQPIYEYVKIRGDTVLGVMGSTGTSTGAHLHFEIKLNGQVVNPLSLVTIPDSSPWVGNVPCLAKGATSLRTSSIFTSFALPGDDDPYDENKDIYDVFMPPFSYIEEGNPFSINLKGNKFLADSCLLKPSDFYDWSVQACCNWDGTNCGPIASWSFSTSKKIERLRQGTEAGTESDPEIIYKLEDANLRWCEMRFEDTVKIGGKEETIYLLPDRYEVDVQQKLPRWQFWGLSFWKEYQTHPIVEALGGSIFRIAAPPDIAPPTHVRNDEYLLFTKSDYAEYRWRVRGCIGEEDEQNCNEFTPYQYIKVSPDVKIEAPELLSPSDDPNGKSPIGWPIRFRWSASLGANSYYFKLFDSNNNLVLGERVEGTSSDTGEVTRIHEVILPREEVNLELDSEYRWEVTSCWDTKAQLCESEKSERKFKTTGRPPLLEDPDDGVEGVEIPLSLRWENVPGARSYVLNFNGAEAVVTSNRGRVNYPVLEQNSFYTWFVRSCNDPQGTVCGDKSETRYFRTISLSTPENLSPESADYFLDTHKNILLSWDKLKGANYYQLSVSCGGETIFNNIIQENEKIIQLTCVGDNNWTVKGCIDENCQDAGEASQGHFILHEGAISGVGFVPCGLSYNNPSTPWNEREACRLSHLFIMLKIIMDFLFWNLMPIILVIMIIVSGIVFYVSLGDPNILKKIKGIWASIGKGLLVMFLGWTAISIIMAIMGYTGIFGPWWQISF